MPPRKTTVRAEDMSAKSTAKLVRNPKNSPGPTDLPESRKNAGSAPMSSAAANETNGSASEKNSATRKASFTYHAPNARDVFVAGSFNEWNPRATPLKRQNDGKWSAEFPLASGTYQYRFVVDGEWVNDPSACRSVDNGFGTSNCVLEV